MYQPTELLTSSNYYFYTLRCGLGTLLKFVQLIHHNHSMRLIVLQPVPHFKNEETMAEQC